MSAGPTTNLRQRLSGEARRLGFSLVGVAPATEADGFPRFCDWLDQGYHAGMDYLPHRRDARRHPRSILEPVRSVVMLALDYVVSRQPIPAHHGRVAAYAQGPDYHRVIWDKLGELARWLTEQEPHAICRGVTDTAPLLERDFARRAGLGWFGKNTMLINKHRGSFFLLGALLTNLDLPADPPHRASHCGTCTACLDACPTQAFPAPGVLDARRCISYHTIESRDAIPLDLAARFGNWLFGCDICQEVCPWNRPTRHRPADTLSSDHSSRSSDHPSAESRVLGLPHNPNLVSLDPLDVLTLSAEEFRQRFRATAISRAKWNGLRRNAAIVLGNLRDHRARAALQVAATDPDAAVATAARWALSRIETQECAIDPVGHQTTTN